MVPKNILLKVFEKKHYFSNRQTYHKDPKVPNYSTLAVVSFTLDVQVFLKTQSNHEKNPIFFFIAFTF
jgi:hypothetical protein